MKLRKSLSQKSTSVRLCRLSLLLFGILGAGLGQQGSIAGFALQRGARMAATSNQRRRDAGRAVESRPSSRRGYHGERRCLGAPSGRPSDYGISIAMGNSSGPGATAPSARGKSRGLLRPTGRQGGLATPRFMGRRGATLAALTRCAWIPKETSGLSMPRLISSTRRIRRAK